MSDTENIYEQLTLDDIFKKDLLSDSVSSEDVSKIIVELQKAKQKASKITNPHNIRLRLIKLLFKDVFTILIRGGF